MIFSLAKSPYSFLAAVLYASAASISVAKLPNIVLPIYALQGLAVFLQTPLNLDVLFLLFLLFMVFSETEQILRFDLRLSKPSPFLWSVTIPFGVFIRNVCREILFLLGRFPVFLAGYPLHKCHLNLLTFSKSSSSTKATLPMPYLPVSFIVFMNKLYHDMAHKAKHHTRS